MAIAKANNLFHQCHLETPDVTKHNANINGSFYRGRVAFFELVFEHNVKSLATKSIFGIAGIAANKRKTLNGFPF